MNIKNAAICVLLPLALTVAACKPASPPATSVTIDPADLEDFADEFFPGQLKKLYIPGVVFVFVQQGEVIFARGYGYANLETELPMNPAETVLRIGSISKLFVATAVMQLVEQGRLDLHTDVNQYLTIFQLEDTFSEPVTLYHLLTHTAGFNDPEYVSTTDPANVPPLGAYLAEHMPPQVRPVGESFVYSNHGFALAGYIVEEVAGIPFDLYVQEDILLPLQMEHSSYFLAPTAPLNLATGYFYQAGEQAPRPLDYDADYPGGSIVSTGSDMACFMLANLQGGCYQGGCILQPATLAEMHTKQFATPYEGQNVTLGFVEELVDGIRLIGHSGAIRGFGGFLDMLPERQMGYFIALTRNAILLRHVQLVWNFAKRF